MQPLHSPGLPKSALFLAAVALGALACSHDTVVGISPGPERAIVADIPDRFTTKLDLLVVVDNTEGMAMRQAAMAATFERLTAHLGFVEGGIPDLHVGTVSTDVGTGRIVVPGCTATGDDGRLRVGHDLQSCPQIDGSYLRSMRVGDGLRATNFTGSLPEAMACMASLGESGCAFEQPLASMRHALTQSPYGEPAFLREDAALAVVFLAGEDDCSVEDQSFYAPGFDSAGTLSKFRCFRHGVICDGDDVYLPGRLDGCRPRTGGTVMADVYDHADFLRDLKPNPEQIVVSAFIGDPGAIQLEAAGSGETVALVPTCGEGAEAAFPAVRLDAFASDFDNRGATAPVCGDGSQAAFDRTARQLRQALGTACLAGPVRDIDPDTAGRQVDCQVTLVHAGGHRDPIAACPRSEDPWSSAEVPCHAIKPGPEACGDFPTQLALQMNWGEDRHAPLGSRVEVACLIDSGYGALPRGLGSFPSTPGTASAASLR